jgi:hypothetical protein
VRLAVQNGNLVAAGRRDDLDIRPDLGRDGTADADPVVRPNRALLADAARLEGAVLPEDMADVPLLVSSIAFPLDLRPQDVAYLARRAGQSVAGAAVRRDVVPLAVHPPDEEPFLVAQRPELQGAAEQPVSPEAALQASRMARQSCP